uniref:FAM3 metabolism regulating signaling molecule D n=1 Tax=Hucho hucho TaxID=62062 RepID=A0A4W5MGD4_9TELE
MNKTIKYNSRPLTHSVREQYRERILQYPSTSSVYNNIMVELNIVLVNVKVERLKRLIPSTCILKVRTRWCFLREIKLQTIVLLASDDPATKMTDAVRETFVSLGSTGVMSLETRDGWVFVRAGDMNGQSPFEKVVKNNVETNVYDGWPGVVEVGGCIQSRSRE